MRLHSLLVTNACDVLHQRRVPLAESEKTQPSGGDDGCGGLLGDRAAPRARLAAPWDAPLGRALATSRQRPFARSN
ncbi:unnamed protein product [Parnassius apollo]|uniref:(apollo) hypothetical protein n=1 Tax=Parnassius apollo TaxID=110799 RepID=A0A8S3Y7Z6_PARAO|nr:unnamed protein product [Parnassius apollo]